MGTLWQSCLLVRQAQNGAVGARASASTCGSIENGGLLTSQALHRQQPFVASSASTTVTVLLLCCQIWILQVHTTQVQHRVSLIKPLMRRHALDL